VDKGQESDWDEVLNRHDFNFELLKEDKQRGLISENY
jgi:hypothetical protein